MGSPTVGSSSSHATKPAKTVRPKVTRIHPYSLSYLYSRFPTVSHLISTPDATLSSSQRGRRRLWLLIYPHRRQALLHSSIHLALPPPPRRWIEACAPPLSSSLPRCPCIHSSAEPSSVGLAPPALLPLGTVSLDVTAFIPRSSLALWS
jgi:hypothetical protein